MAEVRKMEIIPIDEGYMVQKLQENEAERISLAQFKEWSAGPDAKIEEEVEDKKDPFGNSSRVPERFTDSTAFHGKVKVQHPCYTTTSHDIGIKKPSQVDMPVKWRGKEVRSLASRGCLASSCCTLPRCILCLCCVLLSDCIFVDAA